MERYLFVIDYQNDFVDGALGFPGAEKLDAGIAAKIRSYGKGRVFFTRDTHFENYPETREGKNLPVQHCIKGTDGWQIAEVLQEFAENAVAIVEKPSFGYTGWQEIAAGYDEITLGGLCTDICVISNAMLLKAFFPEIRLRIDSTCCAGVTAESHNNALQSMKMCQMDII